MKIIKLLCSKCERYYEMPDKYSSRFCSVCHWPTTDDITWDLVKDLVKKRKASHPRNKICAERVAQKIERLSWEKVSPESLIENSYEEVQKMQSWFTTRQL